MFSGGIEKETSDIRRVKAQKEITNVISIYSRIKDLSGFRKVIPELTSFTLHTHLTYEDTLTLS